MGSPYDRDRVRRSSARSVPTNTRRSTWTNNGTQFTMETSSYSGPGIHYQSFSGTAGAPFPSIFPSSPPQPRGPGNGFLGVAMDLLGEIASTQTPSRAIPSRRRSQARSPSHDEENLGSADNDRHGRPRGLLHKVVESVLSSAQPTRSPSSVNRSMQRRANTDRPSQQYRTEERRPSWADSRNAYVEEYNGDEDGENLFDVSDEITASDESEKISSDESVFEKPRHDFMSDDAGLVEDLEKRIDRHKRDIRKVQKSIQQASRRSSLDSALLTRLLAELKTHESACQHAEKELRELKSRSRDRTSQRRPSPSRAESSQQRQSPRVPQNPFASSFPPPGFGPGPSSPPRASYPPHNYGTPNHAFPFGHMPYEPNPFAEFDNFFRPFNAMFNDPNLFPQPRQNFTYSSRPRAHASAGNFPGNPGSQSPPPPNFTPFAYFRPPQQNPPPTLLKPEEAKRLFQTYNEQWNALAPTDPNIPYPARGLKPTALVVRDTLWAPQVNAPVNTWSEETVMQANTQAFFLGVAGLTPQYTESPSNGRIVMSFNKATATPEQVKQLIDILKKEKTRWHSDRLGRRNGGVPGSNEALQRDERARAVFHAVCELMEVAQ